MWAFNETTFTAITANIVQVDWTSTSTKMSTAEGHCICFCTNHSKMTVRTIDIGLYMTNSDLEQNIQAADTPQKHQHFPRSHHTLCPTHCLCRSPLYLHLEYYLLLIEADQVYMELHEISRHIMQNFQAVEHSNTWCSETSSCIFVNTVGYRIRSNSWNAKF